MKNIICFGDSITHGEEFAMHQRWTSLLQEKLNTLQDSAYKVYNRGIGGNTTSQGMDRFASEVLPLLPGVLVIEFGFNDANVKDWSSIPRVSLNEFARNLREFVAIAARHRSQAVLVVNHLIGDVDGDQGNGERYSQNFAAYNACIKNIAHELNTPCIDLPEQMQQRQLEVSEFVSADGIHLSLQANSHYAEMIYQGLLPVLNR